VRISLAADDPWHRVVEVIKFSIRAVRLGQQKNEKVVGFSHFRKALLLGKLLHPGVVVVGNAGKVTAWMRYSIFRTF
jgi:hypothetical protein